ncbi:protein kinase domain-containing protein [Parafrankia discariae]|uniref:protein kinase domain-containing protein n=1 Tax=Parafrankia discariae TaxID=365528 RepID=UPI0003AA1E3B|nr:protein kinase [Parafrankia discariae]
MRGRKSTPTTPPTGPVAAFGRDLRAMRHQAGNPSYRALARRVGLPAEVLADAVGGGSLPPLDVLRAYVSACGGDVDSWQARWHELAAILAAERETRIAPPGADVPAQPPPAGPWPPRGGPWSPRGGPWDGTPGAVPSQRRGGGPADDFLSPLDADDPREVGPFRLRGRLGSGGMGAVYLGHSPGQRPVAVKVIRADMASDGEFRRRFEREVAAMGRVNSLFTAPLIAADVIAARPWLATAYIHGPTLRDSVLRNGPLPPSSLLRLAAGVTEALVAIHGAGIVHRDLKPANVLLAIDGPRVIDFGIARAAEHAGSTTTGKIIGSPPYMSPEQARGERVDAASDVFALGSVLAFAATGRNAFGEGNTADVIYRVVREEPELTGVDRDLRALIESCLAKAPQRRPTPAEILGRCHAQLGASPRPPSWLPVPVIAEISQRLRHPAVVDRPAEPAHRPARGLVVAASVLATAAIVTMTPARGVLTPWELLPSWGDGAQAPRPPSSPPTTPTVGGVAERRSAERRSAGSRRTTDGRGAGTSAGTPGVPADGAAGGTSAGMPGEATGGTVGGVAGGLEQGLPGTGQDPGTGRGPAGGPVQAPAAPQSGGSGGQPAAPGPRRPPAVPQAPGPGPSWPFPSQGSGVTNLPPAQPHPTPGSPTAADPPPPATPEDLPRTTAPPPLETPQRTTPPPESAPSESPAAHPGSPPVETARAEAQDL